MFLENEMFEILKLSKCVNTKVSFIDENNAPKNSIHDYAIYKIHIIFFHNQPDTIIYVP